MSAIHPGNLHGSGTRMNKSRYHYARQRVQDAQKGKLDESDGPKKEPEVKASSRSIVMVGLVVLLIATWGVAATAYLGIVDYKGLIAKSSDITSADATEYASSLYPFQYEAARHPLRSIGTFLTAIDDTVTNFFTVTKAPFQIIDKRHVVMIAPVRLMKKKIDVTKRETEQPQAEATKQTQESESKQPEDVVGTGKSQEEPKQGEARKPSEDKPQSSKDSGTKQQEQDKNAEKPKDISLNLDLHLFVGQDHTISETHLVSDNGSILQIGMKTLMFPQKNSKITPQKALFFLNSPINKANIAFCHGNPPVRRLVLDGRVSNKFGYGPDAHNFESGPPSGSGEKKTVVSSVPIYAKYFAENVPLVSMANSKIFSRHGNSEKYFEKKLIVDTSPFGNYESYQVLKKNNDENHNSETMFCRKPCFLELSFLNKYFWFRSSENDENLNLGEGRLTTSSHCMGKLTKNLKNKSKNRNAGDKARNLKRNNHGASELPNDRFGVSTKFHSENGEKNTQKPQNLTRKRENQEVLIDLAVDYRENVYLSAFNRYVRDISRFARWKILRRGMQNPNLNKFIRHGGQRMLIRRMINPNGRRIVRRPLPGQKMIIRGLLKRRAQTDSSPKRVIRNTDGMLKRRAQSDSSPKRVIRNNERIVKRRAQSDSSTRRVTRNTERMPIRRVQNPSPNKTSQNVGYSFPSSKKIIQIVNNPHSNKLVSEIKSHLTGERIQTRRVENPSQNKPSRNAQGRIFNRKVNGRMVAISKVGDFVRGDLPRKKRLLFSRLTTAGTGAFQRRISMPRLRKLLSKRYKISPRKKLASREKLKQKFSRIFDRTYDVISTIATVIRKLDIFERSYKILPKQAKNYIEKAKNFTVISKIVDVMVNTTISDAFQFSKTTAQKIWCMIHEKCLNFYNFLKRKPSFRHFFIRLSKFGQKMQLKFEKLSNIIGDNFVMFQQNQKLLTSLLVILSVIGLYHIFFSCLISIFRSR